MEWEVHNIFESLDPKGYVMGYMSFENCVME